MKSIWYLKSCMHFAFESKSIYDRITKTLSLSPCMYLAVDIPWVVFPSLMSRKLHVTPAYLMKLTDSFHFRSFFVVVVASAFPFSFFSRWFLFLGRWYCFQLIRSSFSRKAYLQIVNVYWFADARRSIVRNASNEKIHSIFMDFSCILR